MIPICFEYAHRRERIFVTVLQEFRHHYTGEVVYRIRREGSTGWADEELCSVANMKYLLSERLKEETC